MRLPSALHSASSVVVLCWCFLSCLRNGDAMLMGQDCWEVKGMAE